MKLRFLVATLAMAALPFSAFPVTVDIDYVIKQGEPPGFHHTDPAKQAERRAALERAVNIWETQLDGSITLKLRAYYTNLLSPGSLAGAKPTSASANLDALPFSDTFYPAALASQLAMTSLPAIAGDAIGSHMRIRFNDNYNGGGVGGIAWTYDLSGTPASNQYSFLHAAIHELGHAFGMASLVDRNPARSSFGDWINNLIVPVPTTPAIVPYGDIFSRLLTRTPAGGGPNDQDFFAMNATQRAAALDSDEVYFTGANLIAAAEFTPAPTAPLASFKGEIQMSAPTPLVGSALTHFEKNHTPDLIMKPTLLTGFALYDIDAAREVMQDLGWSLLPPPGPGSLAVVYVDFAFTGEEYGSEALPVNTLAEAVDLVMSGGNVNIDSGTSNETLTISKAMTVNTLGGTVTIGAP